MSARDESARRLEDLSRVLDVTRATAAEKDLGRLLEMLVHRTSEVMDAERTSLFLLDRTSQELWSKVAEGGGFTEIRFPAGSGLAGHVARTGETLRIRDAYEDPRFNREIDRSTGFRTRSVLCMALRDYSGEIVGVIQVLNKRQGEFTDYDEWLLGALAAQAGVSLSQAALIDHLIEKRRLERDMELAREIQRGLLPSKLPEARGLSFAVHYESCDETGGDYLDILAPRAGAQGVGAVVADVSGHGLPAALLAAAVRATVHSLWREGLPPRRILATANELLAPDLSPDRFASMFIASIRPGAGLRYASAGHEPPLIWRAGRGEFETLEPTGLIIGVLESAEYSEGEARPLEPGDALVATTDGVFEARSPSDEMFGRERVREVVAASARRGAGGIAEALAGAVGGHIGDSKQTDDVTFIVIGGT